MVVTGLYIYEMIHFTSLLQQSPSCCVEYVYMITLAYSTNFSSKIGKRRINGTAFNFPGAKGKIACLKAFE